MGLLISRFRSKKTTIEILEDIDKEINSLQKNRKQNQERQKKIVTSLLIYSIAAYILAAIIFFVYYFPETWPLRLLYSLPLLVFPVLIWGIKKVLHWYFVKRIASNDGALLKLREQKKSILEDVMETETYKKAKEILEKFDPVRFKKMETLSPTNSPGQSTADGTPGTSIHQRRPAVPQAAMTPHHQVRSQMMAATPRSSMHQPPRLRPPPTSTPLLRPATTPQLPPRHPTGSSVVRQQQQQVQHQMTPAARQQQQMAAMGGTPGIPRGYGMPPALPMPRSVLPQKRGTMDRLVDYLVGDGPENRYALICRQCHSHNGMALKEEFEYLTFRCCYCYYVNPARKQRPLAPKLEFFAPRGFNTDSQGSAASDDDSEDNEEDEDESDGKDTKRSQNKQPTSKPTPGNKQLPASASARLGNRSNNAPSVVLTTKESAAVPSVEAFNPSEKSGALGQSSERVGGAQTRSVSKVGKHQQGGQTVVVAGRSPSKEVISASAASKTVEKPFSKEIMSAQPSTTELDNSNYNEVTEPSVNDSATTEDVPYADEQVGEDSAVMENEGYPQTNARDLSVDSEIFNHDHTASAATSEVELSPLTVSGVQSEVDVLASGDFTTEVCDQDKDDTAVPDECGAGTEDGGALTLSGEIRGSIKSLLSPTHEGEVSPPLADEHLKDLVGDVSDL